MNVYAIRLPSIGPLCVCVGGGGVRAQAGGRVCVCVALFIPFHCGFFV